MSTTALPITREQNPWPGLFWYSEKQANLFFGREAETEEMLHLIQRETLTVLFGRSGLGKTSLLRAGVFPRLRLTGYFPVVLRLDYALEANGPGQQVIALTEAAARESGIDIERAEEGDEPPTLWEHFHRTHFWGPRNDRVTPVLVFDQFEEIFTVGGRSEARTDFLGQLADLAENRIPGIVRQRAEESTERPVSAAGVSNYKIVLSLREDFVWRLDTLRPILPAVMRNRFALGPLDVARGLEIVRKAGAAWVTEEVAQDIVEAVISSQRGEGSASFTEEVEPAYLNVMCNELFERMLATGQTTITRELVAAEKGGILESLYERSLRGLGAAARLFVEEHLVTPAGFRVTLPVEDARREHVSDADIEKLVDRRLLRFEDRLGARHIELAHDLLTGLARKGREERNAARLQQELRRARLRTAILGAAALLVIAAGVIYWLAFVRQTDSYYATFTRRHDHYYEPIRRLSKDEVQHRRQSLMVTRKGFAGKILAIKAVDAHFQPICGTDRESSLFFPNRRFCRLELEYSEKNNKRVNYEVARDEGEHMLFALIYVPETSQLPPDLQHTGGAVRRALVIGPDANEVLSSFDIQYDSRGYIQQVTFLSGGGIPPKSGASVAQQTNTSVEKPPILRWQRDQRGYKTEESYFDTDGKPVIWGEEGYHRVSFIRDRGDLREERFFGVDGAPVPRKKDGCYGIRYEDYAFGLPNRSICVDAQGNPMSATNALPHTQAVLNN